MRDFQTVPPKDGSRFEAGLTIKEGKQNHITPFPCNASSVDKTPWVVFLSSSVGVLNFVHRAAMETIKANVSGHWLEAGVWRGGTSVMLRSIQHAYHLQDKAVIIADSFQGIPSESLQDWEERYDVPKDNVLDNLNRSVASTIVSHYPFLLKGRLHVDIIPSYKTSSPCLSYGLLDTPEPLHIVEGFFADSLPPFTAGWVSPPLRLSLLLADADAFESSKDILTHLYTYLSVGGYVIIDDFHISQAR